MTNSSEPCLIAFLDSYFWHGGSLVFEINLIRELEQRGFVCQIFSFNDIHPPPKDLKQLDIPLNSEPSWKIFEDRVLGVVKKLAAFKPRAVIANIGDFPCEALRYLPPDTLRVGVVHAEAQLQWIENYHQVMDCIVTVSQRNCDLVRQKFGDALNVRCIEMGFPLPAYFPRNLTTSSEPLRILYLGRLEDHAKRVRLFPSIFKHLKKLNIPFVWTIAGTGPELEFLKIAMAEQNDRQKVIFKGLVPYDSVPALLAENDVLLLTSDTETFSLSLHEGMAAGLVPVASDLPGTVGEIVTPERGIRVPLENTDGYADALARLHQHREELLRMSQNCVKAISAEYSAEAMANRWLTMLNSRSTVSPVWPERWRIKMPLFKKNRWRLTTPMRWLRRVAANVRHLVG